MLKYDTDKLKLAFVEVLWDPSYLKLKPAFVLVRLSGLFSLSPVKRNRKMARFQSKPAGVLPLSMRIAVRCCSMI